MASRVGDPAKLAEAQDEFAKGSKALATSAFKWKADYLTAEPHFKAAARLFKSGGMQDKALYVESRLPDRTPFQGARTMHALPPGRNLQRGVQEGCTL